jgi:molecular chaperone DnaK
MSQVVGIDLGTTNTVVAAVRDGQARALPDEHGQTLIPSVVSFHPNGSVLVGRNARDRRVLDPNSTIYSVKRLIGRSWDTPEVQRARARLPFEMREGPGQATLVAARGETYTLPEISAFVLRKAKSVAEAALGTTVDRAVITVPANFNDLQRAATKVAGRVAGLEVLRILNEPTAAALAYGYGKSTSERLVVYDFGGGTFDVTLLDLSNNVFEVLATAGNTFLGGDDIDLAIAERMAEQFLRQHRYDVRTDPVAFDRCRIAAEQMKQQLSTETSASARIEEMTHGPGGKSIDLEFVLTRAEFEAMVLPIVEQTFEVCSDALGVARLGVESLDQVLLVGGSTRIPLVREQVQNFFGRAGEHHISPDEVVAIGAAIQASALRGAERRRGTVPPPPAVARRANTAPGVGRDTQPGGGTAAPDAALGRLRLSSIPDTDDLPTSAPTTQPFEPRRNVPTRPGLQPPPRPPASEARPPTSTLMGLGNRGRVKTDDGLGPEAEKAIAADPLAALKAQEEITAKHVVTPVMLEPDDAESIADSAVESVPEPLLPDLPEDDDDVPTFVGKSPRIQTEPFQPVPAPSHLLATPPFARPAAEMPEAPLLPPTPTPVAPPVSPPGSVTQPLTVPTLRLPSPLGASPLVSPPLGSSPFGSSPAQERPQPSPSVAPPVLIDVTPLTLSVETVGGYCDALIPRNTPVPCDRTREFVTAADNQTVVRVRVCQGESSRFVENTVLGELELSALRPGLRGTVQISVTFALDTNGMLNVSARDAQTGYATSAQVHLVGLPGAEQIGGLAARHAGQRAV